MTTTCKNCDGAVNGAYCGTCGQSATTHPINLSFVWHDVQHGLLHFDKGMLFTAKELFTRPGHSIREFIQGKRVRHFKPVSLVLVLAGAFGLLYHLLHIDMIGSLQASSERKGMDLVKINEWMGEHYALMELIYVPLFAFASRLAFRKSDYNLIEHIVLNAFLSGQRLLVNLASMPFLYAFNGTAHMRAVSITSSIIGVGLTFWTYGQFFAPRPWWNTAWRTLLTYIILCAEILFASLLVGIVVALLGRAH